MEKDKKEIDVKFSKTRSESVGREPLAGEKHILWDQILAEITKFKSYLTLVDD